MNTNDTDVIIVGGGPVGLFLGCLLLQDGISCRILEHRNQPSEHTRSIGIHPPALERLTEIGIVDELIGEGIAVTDGVAFANSKYLGTLTFESCPPPYQFVLALPQFVTEGILERRLFELDGSALIRGVEVSGVAEDADAVIVTANQNDRSMRWHARYVVGCDGRNSQVRKSIGIAFPGGEYVDKFLMGDFDDTSDLGSRAGIFLTDRGVIESFPLPGKVRRWVVKTDDLLENAAPEILTRMIRERTNREVAASTCSMISAFSVSHHLAARMAQERVLLAGDSAHVVSPIGGQGMNLGWMDAWEASVILAQAIRNGEHRDRMFENYSRERRRAARVVRKRAEFNMWMGRSSVSQKLKYASVKMALNTPLKNYFASRFTMRGL